MNTIRLISKTMTSNKLILLTILLMITLIGFGQEQETESPLTSSRQVHLDFHTSEHIPDIGEKFSKKQFQEALKIGHVNHINVFAKCCHSWSYYPTKVGSMHPNLKFDLLGAQIEACHEIGVKCPIYYIVGWSTNDAINHPEWCARNKDGSFVGLNYDYFANDTTERPFNSWRTLCWLPGGAYHQNILKQVEEICQKYKTDGFWFDMYHILPRCYCENCMTRYKREGVNINDDAAVEKSMALASKEHMKELRKLIAKYHSKATVFFNATPHVNNSEVFEEKLYDLNTQQELEDLPTTWGGYDKLPIEAKFHLGNKSRVVAMSGKFHKAWGEFGGFKDAGAIKYEAAAMIANGAACNFGDQLHPAGEMDLETYRNIGEAYQYVEKIEQYGLGGVPVSRLGLWLSLHPAADYGVANMLLEIHDDFVIANERNLDQLSLLIVPSKTQLTYEQANQINAWVKKGGKLITFGKGAMDATGKRFLLDVGAEYVGAPNFKFDYTRVKSSIGDKIVRSPFLNYESAVRVKPTSATVLAAIVEPYFGRTYGKYSSHRETPYRLEEAEHPAVIRNGNVIYFAHNLDQLYYTHAVRLHRQLVKNAIDLFYNSPMLEVKNLPSAGRVSFLKQESKNRYVAHLLYSPALQRGEVMVIEDFLPVPNIQLDVDIPERIKSIVQIPEGKKLDFKRVGNKIVIDVPTFTMHSGIVINY